MVENARQHLANPDFQRDAMAVIERTVTNLRELMAQVSAVARSPEMKPEACGLRELVQDALQAAGLVSGTASGIQTTVRTHGEDRLTVDRRQVVRLLTNLLTNAREALNGGGEIELEAELSGRDPQGATELTLTVRDNGRGMDEEFIRTALFKPFASTKSSGLGIGLTQCRSIVEAHGGTISVESRAGVGTRFVVRLPVPPSAPGPALEPAP